MKTKKKMKLSGEERERRKIRGKELAELRREKMTAFTDMLETMEKEKTSEKEIPQIRKDEEVKVAPKEGKEIKPTGVIQFHCNLANTQIGNIRFSDHLYKTSNPKEIEFLKSFGAKQGCIVKEVKEESKK